MTTTPALPEPDLPELRARIGLALSVLNWRLNDPRTPRVVRALLEGARVDDARDLDRLLGDDDGDVEGASRDDELAGNRRQGRRARQPDYWQAP